LWKWLSTSWIFIVQESLNAKSLDALVDEAGDELPDIAIEPVEAVAAQYAGMLGYIQLGFALLGLHSRGEITTEWYEPPLCLKISRVSRTS
jgi:hypothetical protein